MDIRADFLQVAREVGEGFVSLVTARDGLCAHPGLISRAAARRFRGRLAALAAYLRRLLLCLALKIEPSLTEGPARRRHGRPLWRPGGAGFRVMAGGRSWPEAHHVIPRGVSAGGDRRVPTAPLFAKLAEMARLLKSPEARAQRLAWHLARRVPFVHVPDFGTRLRLRGASEGQPLFLAMAHVIFRAHGGRPPGLGPPPRPPPRIRRC